MRKIVFFGISLLLLCLAVWEIHRVFKPHGDVSGEDVAAKLSAANLYADFLHNENNANQKWIGKVIEVSGIISSIGETGNYISITLRATTDGGINCSASKRDLNTDRKFNIGDFMTIKGRCTGFLADVNMVDCIIK